MKIAISGTKKQCEEVIRLIYQHPNMKYRTIFFMKYETAEDCTNGIQKEEFDAVIILLNGAEGMENAISVKDINPKLQLVWLSDDKMFALQAYRIQTTYFNIQPVTKETIDKVISVCRF